MSKHFCLGSTTTVPTTADIPALTKRRDALTQFLHQQQGSYRGKVRGAPLTEEERDARFAGMAAVRDQLNEVEELLKVAEGKEQPTECGVLRISIPATRAAMLAAQQHLEQVLADNPLPAYGLTLADVLEEGTPFAHIARAVDEVRQWRNALAALLRMERVVTGIEDFAGNPVLAG